MNKMTSALLHGITQSFSNKSAYPKASIVILTYNAVSTLGEVLDKVILSALNQD